MSMVFIIRRLLRPIIAAERVLLGALALTSLVVAGAGCQGDGGWLYEVTGTVVDGETGEPVVAASISVSAPDADLYPCTAVTDEAGKFSCELVSDGLTWGFQVGPSIPRFVAVSDTAVPPVLVHLVLEVERNGQQRTVELTPAPQQQERRVSWGHRTVDLGTVEIEPSERNQP